MYDVINRINLYIINPLIIILFTVAVVVFVWGVFDLFIRKGGDEDRNQGKRHVVYGVIGMVIMIGVFTIIHTIIDSTSALLGTPINNPQTLP